MRPTRAKRNPYVDSSALERSTLLINSRRDGDSVTVTLSGELDLASVDEVDVLIRDAEETDVGRIVVDLSDVSFIDSTGLNVLLWAKQRSDGRLRCIPSSHDAVTRLLQITGTLEMFD